MEWDRRWWNWTNYSRDLLYKRGIISFLEVSQSLLNMFRRNFLWMLSLYLLRRKIMNTIDFHFIFRPRIILVANRRSQKRWMSDLSMDVTFDLHSCRRMIIGCCIYRRRDGFLRSTERESYYSLWLMVCSRQSCWIVQQFRHWLFRDQSDVDCFPELVNEDDQLHL